LPNPNLLLENYLLVPRRVHFGYTISFLLEPLYEIKVTWCFLVSLGAVLSLRTTTGQKKWSKRKWKTTNMIDLCSYSLINGVYLYDYRSVIVPFYLFDEYGFKVLQPIYIVLWFRLQ